MPKCQHCEAHVTADYVRVFSANGQDDVRVCPNCEDRVRDKHGKPRQARADRDTDSEATTAETDYSHEAVADGGGDGR